MIKLCVYVPESHLELVKQAMFKAGAGRIGLYEECAWQTLGQGQFRPLSGSNPYVGEEGCVEVIPEYQLEMVCKDELVGQVIAAMKQAHPYEEPAYAAWRLLDI
jgi:hypothetical protein